jgi:NAD(P)-dependent dehydrogenase (short-subunit alcohol dehydrogenase family)
MPPPDSPVSSMGFIWWSARNPPHDPETSFAGKTVLITGANSGLGFEALLKFAALGASRLIVGVRSLERGQAAIDEVFQRTGYKTASIAMYALDMSTFDGVKSFVTQIQNHEPRIDIAVLNAGMGAPSHKLSPEGYEMCVQVNGLSTALVGLLLLPKLRASSKLAGSPSHLEIVGSAGHHEVTAAGLDFPPGTTVLDGVSQPTYFGQRTQYCATKLLNMYTADGLVAEQSKYGGADEVIITVACPGLCRSGMGRSFPKWQQVLDGGFKKYMARSSEEGSRTIVSGVTLGKEAHGQFWSHDVFFR